MMTVGRVRSMRACRSRPVRQQEGRREQTARLAQAIRRRVVPRNTERLELPLGLGVKRASLDQRPVFRMIAMNRKAG